jgi:cytochrome oxidase Cu insertion factor (SCO1/SenC/PrrC family)
MKKDRSGFRKVFVVVLFIFLAFFARSIKADAGSIHINGSVEGVPGDSVVFYLHPYFSFFWQNSNATEYDVAVHDNKFALQATLQCPHSYVTAYLKNNGRYQTLFRLFLVVPGDSIDVTVKKDTLIFKGKGAAKFICQYKIQKVPEINFTKQELLSFKNNNTDLAFNRYRKKKSDSLLKLKLDIVDRFKPELQKRVYEQVRLNLISENLLNQYKSLSLDFKYDSSEAYTDRNDQIIFFHDLEDCRLPRDFDDKLLAESSSAPDYLLYKAMREIQFGDYLLKKHFTGSYDPLSLARIAGKGYGQPLKERLLAVSFGLFYRPQNESDIRKLDTAFAETQSAYFHNYLNNLKAAMNPHIKAYDFTLFTPEDKKITLDDFKGRVVVLDFWFRGCGYCAILEQRMKNIRRVFENDAAVVFISVNMDTNKEQFLKGIASGKYTGENEINLYTKGAAFDHPLAKHYNIIGCPELIIIDKQQRTFMSKPTRPTDEISDQEFIDLVLKAEMVSK